MPAVAALPTKIVLSEDDATLLPDMPAGWPFRVSRWPIASQWERLPSRRQTALAIVRLSTGLGIPLDFGEEEAPFYARIVEPFGLAWAETEAHYQIVCDALSDVQCPNMGSALASGEDASPEGGP